VAVSVVDSLLIKPAVENVAMVETLERDREGLLLATELDRPLGEVAFRRSDAVGVDDVSPTEPGARRAGDADAISSEKLAG
jgi:hypothetical protein